MSEELLGVISHTEGRGKGRFMKRFALVFTSERILVAKITGTLGVALSGLSGVVGELERMALNRKVKEKSEKFTSVSVEDILKADKDNYAIPYSEILKVEMKKGGFLWPPNISIQTKDKKYSFKILEKKEYDRYVDLVRTALPDKVYIK